MVLFSIHLRPYNQTSNIRAQLVGTGIHAQKNQIKRLLCSYESWRKS